MIRIASIAVSVVSLLLITAIVNGAGKQPAPANPLVVEISAFESTGKVEDSAQLALPPNDAKPLSSIKALIGQDGSFLAEATVGERIIRLSGNVKSSDDNQQRVSLDYSDTSTTGVQSITSMVMLPVGERKAVGGMSRGETRSVLVLTMGEHQPDKKK